MVNYTTPSKVQSFLGLQDAFTISTSPSLSTVEAWISEVESDLASRTSNKYGSESKVDVLDYDGVGYLLTRHAPISNVVVELNTAKKGEAPVWSTLSLHEDYIVEDARGRVSLVNLKNKSFKEGKQKFRVSYDAGLGSVPLWLESLATKMVGLRVMNTALNNRVVNSEDASQVRVGQVSVIKPSDFGNANYSLLKSEVMSDLDRLGRVVTGVRYVNY